MESSSSSFTLLTWNIDGLDNRNISIRTEAVGTIIQREKPDVVFLQEVLEEQIPILDVYLSDDYERFSGRNLSSKIPYFTLTLLKRSAVQSHHQQIVPFPSTQMGRTLLILKAKIGEVDLTLINTHLESLRENEQERVKQTQMAFQWSLHLSSNVILAGDLNMRDKEVEEAGGFPEHLVDFSKALGSQKLTRFRWDLVTNDNKQFVTLFAICQFVVKDVVLELRDFRFVGMDRIPTSLCFPSDHWGILATFALHLVQ